MTKKTVVPKITVVGKKLKEARQKIGASEKRMVELLCAPSMKEYRRWEKEGLLAPHDTEGPTGVIVKIILRLKGEELKMALNCFGYKT